MRRPGLAGIIAAALTSASAAHSGFTVPANTPGQFAPKDECGAVAGAGDFRKALGDAVKRRDAAALAALASPDILLDYGGGAGRDELRQRLRGNDGKALWGELEKLLGLGCAFADGDLMLPWFFAQDLGDVDPYDAWLVTGPDVPLLPKPDAHAKPLRRLSWQLVSIGAGFDLDAQYQPVSLINGKAKGYVETARLRSQVDYRAIAERKGGVWRLTAFIAGD